MQKDSGAAEPADVLHHQLIWADLETGGLNPRAEQILEIALVATVGPDFEASGHVFTCLVKPKRVGDLYTQVGSWANEQHTKSGLIAEAEQKGISETQAEQDVLAWLKGRQRPGERFVLAGSSVHFDMEFLRVRMPLVAKLFTHRLLDVSALKLARNIQTGRPLDEGFLTTEKEDNARHRALDDIESTLRSMRSFVVRRMDKDVSVLW